MHIYKVNGGKSLIYSVLTSLFTVWGVATPQVDTTPHKLQEFENFFHRFLFCHSPAVHGKKVVRKANMGFEINIVSSNFPLLFLQKEASQFKKG